MSKYQKLWEYVAAENREELLLSFEEIEKLLGFPIDHSFLSFKKELLPFGFEVKKNLNERKNGEIYKNGGLTYA